MFVCVLVLLILQVISCEAISAQSKCDSRILVNERFKFSGPPPRTIPKNLSFAYTRCNTIPIEEYYVDDTKGGVGLDIVYTEKQVQQYLKSAERSRNQIISSKRDQINPKTGSPTLSYALYLHNDLVKDKRVLIIGSNQPSDESMVLVAGASHVVTLEYQNITYKHPQLSQYRSEAFWANVSNRNAFEIVSIYTFNNRLFAFQTILLLYFNLLK
jgi:hypothetical protein